MYIDSLTIAAVIVFIVYLAAFLFGCVLHDCRTYREDELPWAAEVHRKEGSWRA